MKNYFPLLLLFLFTVAMGCQKTDDGNYVKPLSIPEKITGTWQLSSITQIDNVAKAASLEPSEVKLTTLFNFSTFKITLNVDEDMNPTTYQITGLAPELFNNSGYWALDHNFVHTDGTPSTILLYSDEQKTELTDELMIAALPGQRDVLDFKLIRSKNGNPFLTYHYSLKLVN